MEYSKICSIRDCKNIAQAFCKCLDQLPAFCKTHMLMHFQKYCPLKQPFEALFTPLSHFQKQRLLDIKNCMTQKLVQDIDYLITQYKTKLSKLTTKIRNLQEYYNSKIISIKEEYLGILMKTRQYLLDGGVFGGEKQQNQFLNLLANLNPQKAPYLNSSLLFYFLHRTKIFCTLDIQKMKIHIQQIPQLKREICDYSMCSVELNKLFFLLEQNPFILDVQKYSIRNTPSLPLSNKGVGLTKYRSSFFSFGGYYIFPIYKCFVFQREEWKEICNLPSGSGFTCCLVVGERILVTGSCLKQILSYIPEENRFQILFDGLFSQKQKQLLLSSKGEVICLVEHDYVYVGGRKDLKEWIKKGKTRGSLRGISERVQRSNFIFYVNKKRELVVTNIHSYEQSIEKIIN